MSKIHIYGQPMWHCDAGIVANKEALVAMRVAIDKALIDNEAIVSTMTDDGEGYDIIIVCKEDNWDEVAFPYTDEIAQERRDNVKWPSQLVSNYKKLKGL